MHECGTPWLVAQGGDQQLAYPGVCLTNTEYIIGPSLAHIPSTIAVSLPRCLHKAVFRPSHHREK